MAMQYIGFHLDKESIEKLKMISFIEKKDRSTLLREGIELVFQKYKSSFDKFEEFVQNIKK